jgi:hypothetical protein
MNSIYIELEFPFADTVATRNYLWSLRLGLASEFVGAIVISLHLSGDTTGMPNGGRNLMHLQQSYLTAPAIIYHFPS